MSFANPTQLRLGARGNLAGKNYRVIGRVVMSVEVAGETYYWNEFNLECGGEENATLAYEETERGGEWRLFTMFEPEYPMTAEDAATKRVGDPLNLDGTDVRVTLVDSSRVRRIEGQAPEGVEVGDVANYFNAESGSVMQVVSWTGDEVEYFRGETLARGTVEKAFGISKPVASNFTFIQSGNDSGSNLWSLGIFVVVLAVGLFAFLPSCRSTTRRTAAIKSFAAPPSPLKVGITGRLSGANYRIAGHDVVEIAEVGRRFERHEFTLWDDDGHPALLVCSIAPNSKDWLLLKPLQAFEPLTPSQAGNVRLGEVVNVDGIIAPVSHLFHSTSRRAEDSTLPAWIDLATYGFMGRTNNAFVLARWNQAGIAFHQGKLLADQEVLRAFNAVAAGK